MRRRRRDNRERFRVESGTVRCYYQQRRIVWNYWPNARIQWIGAMSIWKWVPYQRAMSARVL